MSKHQEYQYLDILQKIMDEGTEHKNRTGVTTKRLLCEVMRFDLSEEFPLLTTKKVFWKGVAHELLWFLSGSTNNEYLQENGVNIWTPNGQDYYSKMRVKHKEATEEGIEEETGFLCDHPFYSETDTNELGPVYGFQWRHFNGTPQNWKREYKDPGFDQISWAIDQIKNNPESRRTIVSAWNPLQIPQMALPPCHVMFQFSVDGDRLHCTMYIRSNDFFLGSPFNIASYALLTYMFAHVCDLKPGVFNYVANDTHLYSNHIDQAKEQLSREPYPFPTISINPDKKDIFDIKFEDIELINYKCHDAIKAKMAV